MIANHKLILFFITIIMSSCQAQQLFISSNKINTNISSTIPANEIYYDINNSSLFYLHKPNKNKLTIYKSALKSTNKSQSDSVTLVINDYDNIVDLAVSNDEKIALLTYDSLYIYNKSSLEYKNAVTDVTNVKIINDSTLLLYQVYNTHPLDGFTGAKLQVIKKRNNTYTTGESKLMFYEGIQFSHRVKHWVAVANNKIYLTKTLSQKSIVMDVDLNVLKEIPIKNNFQNNNIQSYLDSITMSKLAIVDSMSMNKVSTREIVTYLRRNRSFSVKSFYYDTLLSIDSSIFRVEKVFAFKHYLIYSKKFPNARDAERKIDIYDLKKHKRVITDKYFSLNRDPIKSEQDLVPLGLSYSNKIAYNSDGLLVQYSGQSYIPNKIKYPISREDLKKQLNNYYLDHDGTGTFFVYSINP